jgi:low affinity Fe/Cu permease
MNVKRKATKRSEQSGFERVLENVARKVTAWTGSTSAFALSVSIVVVWVCTGPIFHYSDTWQLVINTGTTVVTFLMVFLIQRSQNKDSLALHLKLNEIVAAMKGASNRMIDVESLTERELRVLHTHFETLARMAKRDIDLLCSHSVEEAELRHHRKVKAVREEVAEEAAVSSKNP